MSARAAATTRSGTTPSGTTSAPPRLSRRTLSGRHRWLPPQHGAWAMLLLPYIAAVSVTGPAWPHLPLLGAWLAGYLFSYYALLAVKTGRADRVGPQLLTYGGVAVLFATVVLAVRPALLGYAPVFALLVTVNVWYARRRQERSLVNDLALVAQSVIVVFMVATVAGVAPAALTGVAGAVGAYLVGTVLFVKTMIRERGNAAYRRASLAYHLMALIAAAAWWGPVAAVVFALLLLRATALAGRSLPPARIGMIELAATVLILVAVLTRWA